ncbi:hypothetical protein NC651_033459 [Populus alba x Populus x berolinensis]|nr:hypothetical protein NC651_033459 [Populus alba x Populus x berolinensis]
MSTGMSSLLHGNPNCSILRNNGATSFVGFSALPFMQLRAGAFMRGRLIPQSLYRKEKFCFPRKGLGSMMSKKVTFTTRSSSEDGSSDQDSFWVHQEGCLVDWSWSHSSRHWLGKWIGGILAFSSLKPFQPFPFPFFSVLVFSSLKSFQTFPFPFFSVSSLLTHQFALPH